MKIFSVILPILLICGFGFAADTMFVLVEAESDKLPKEENIVQSIENRDLKTKNLVNLIAFESGIQKDRSRAIGSFESFSMRGVSGNRIGVFLNGNSLANAGGTAVDLSRYGGLNISRIDIYRGFVPAELGGNPFGGAINIITENYDEFFSTQIFMLLGSFGEFHTFANFNHIPISPKTNLSLFADYHRAKNNFKYMDFNGTFYGKDHEKDDTIRVTDNNRYNALTISGNIKNSQKNFDINGDFSIFASKYEIPSSAGTLYKFRNQSAFDANREYFFGLTQSFHNAAESRMKISYLLSFDEFNWTDKDNIAFPYSLLPRDGRGKISSRNTVFDGGYFHKFYFGNRSLLFLNGTARYEEINYSNDITGFSVSDREVNRLNGAISSDLKFFTRHPEIILGGTIRGYMDKIENWERGFVYQKIPDDTIFDMDKTLRLSVNNSFLSPPLQVFADVVYAEKIPNLRQRYGFYGVIPNTNLLPEKIYSSQIGLITNSPARTRTAFFVNYCEDLIRVIYFGNVGQARNISKTLNYGIENDIFWKMRPKLEISNNITLQNPQNLSETSSKKLYIPQESRLKINTQAIIGDFAGFSLISQYSYLSAYFHDLYNVHRVPFNDSKSGLSFFSFILQHKIKSFTTQIGIYDILASGNSPQKITELESGYHPIRYPGMSIKGSVLWEIGKN